MKIYLAGENGKKRIIGKIVNETIFSGAYHGRQSLERGQNKAADWGGMGSIDENVPCKPAHDTKIQERAAIRNSPIRGGVSLTR